MMPLKLLKQYKRISIIILTPLILLPLPLAAKSSEASCGFCILLMTIYWCTEVFPLAVTSFLPLVLFPLLGVTSAKVVGMALFNNTSWLYAGGMIAAVAVEKTNLHKRIAIKILLTLGTTPHCLMLGFMLPTYILSMWMSNTATTAMMLPILQGVLDQVESCKDQQNEHNVDTAMIDQVEQLQNEGQDVEINVDTINENKVKPSRFDLGMTLCVPYAASIGGITTLTGSPTNIVLSGQFNDLFPDSPLTISFGSWFAYNLPTSLFTIALGYFWLSWFYIGFCKCSSCNCCGRNGNKNDQIQKILDKEYSLLGDMKWSEAVVMILFTTLALLWLTRNPGFMPGWGSLAPNMSDSTVAMGIVVLFFVFPYQRPVLFGGSPKTKSEEVSETILTWDDVHQKFPWAVWILLGGGFAIAKGAVESNLTTWLALKMAQLKFLPPWSICLIITFIASIVTECCSNVTSASIFVPILAQTSVAVGIHPFYLLIPTVVATSLAFMLPVATPPNALAMATGRLRVIDMIKAGCVMNIMGILVVNLSINSIGRIMFGLDEFPEWANATILPT